MEVAVTTLYLGLNPKTIGYKQTVGICIPNTYSQRACCSLRMRDTVQEFFARSPSSFYRESHKFSATACAESLGLEDVGVSASPFEDFTVATTTTSEATEIKLRVDVSGAKTQAIFDNVFSEMVAAAQPIPGFRRAKGGKTPDIPRDVLLHVLGHSKVYMQVIKKIINFTIANYVEKEGLKVTKDLRVEQSFEELEETFEPGEEFSFDAVIQLQETNPEKR